MKFVRALFLLIIVFLLITSNLHSQTEQLHKVLRSNFQDTFHSLEKCIDKSVFEKESFENYSNRILKRVDFDSTSVVDSVIVTKENGDKEKHIYTYDSNGNTISELHESWDGSQWVNGARYTYTLDSNGNSTSYLYEQWDGNQWLNSSKYTYTYDSNGNMTFELIEIWEESQWVNFCQTTYTYDLMGNMT